MWKVLMLTLLFMVGSVQAKDGVLNPRVLNPSDIVADINGKTITLKQFNERYQWYVERFKFKMPKQEFLKNLIDLELTSQEASRRGIPQEEKMLYDYKVLLSQHLLEREVYTQFDKIKISDSEMEKHFKADPEIRASHILFKLDPNAPADKDIEVKKKALEILTKVKAGESFEELAKKYSESPSAKNGGDLDFFSRESMFPEFSDAAFKLKKVGDISDLVRTKYGYHIIKLTAFRDFKSADKRRLQNQLMTQKRKEIYDGFFAKLRKTAKITTNENLVSE